MRYTITLFDQSAIARLREALGPVVVAAVGDTSEQMVFVLPTEEQACGFLRTQFPELVANSPVPWTLPDGIPTLRLPVYRDRHALIGNVVAFVYAEPTSDDEANAMRWSPGGVPYFNFRLWLPADVQKAVEARAIAEQETLPGGRLPS